MKIQSLRKKIDSIDSQILKQLNNRAKLSCKIGALKNSKNALIYAPDREQQVIRSLQKKNKGPITNASLEAIYREIMSSSLSLEKDLSIAYLGPEFTFSHQASIKQFGKSVRYVARPSIADIFADVENGRCDYGVVPVENSTEGAVYHTLDSFMESNLKICSEIQLKINLCLLSKEKSLSRVKKVYSNPLVFGQCRGWLETHLRGVKLISTSSTAKSAGIVTKQKGSACIASRFAAKPNALNTLASNIQDKSTNVTRFLVLSRESAKPTKKDKTSLMISVKDQPGALQRVLNPFRTSRINLTKIESRPSKKKEWEYYFFIDVDGHADSKKLTKTLKAIDRESSFLKILGSYPKA